MSTSEAHLKRQSAKDQTLNIKSFAKCQIVSQMSDCTEEFLFVK